VLAVHRRKTGGDKRASAATLEQGARQVLALEQLAGERVEDLGSYRPASKDEAALAVKLQALGLAAGRFGRYPQVRQAIRDLHNALNRMLDAKRNSEDDRQVRSELDPAYRTLLVECDREVGRESLHVFL